MSFSQYQQNSFLLLDLCTQKFFSNIHALFDTLQAKKYQLRCYERSHSCSIYDPTIVNKAKNVYAASLVKVAILWSSPLVIRFFSPVVEGPRSFVVLWRKIVTIT